MSKTSRRIPVIIVCLTIAALAYFAGYIPFYTYEEEQVHTTTEQFFSTEHLVRLLPFVIIALAAAACILIIIEVREYLGSKKENRQNNKTRKLRGSGKVISQKRSIFMIVRWVIMITFSCLIMFGGILTGAVIHGIINLE